jgi:hypothetical protein
MDGASFLLTLNPEEQEEILLNESDEFLAELPPPLLAQALNLRHRAQSSVMNDGQYQLGSSMDGQSARSMRERTAVLTASIQAEFTERLRQAGVELPSPTYVARTAPLTPLF